MSYMKRSVSVRELQQNLKRIMARAERGDVIEVTRRRRPVATLGPTASRHPVSPWPDLEARSRAVFGGRTVAAPASDVVSEGRGEQ